MNQETLYQSNDHSIPLGAIVSLTSHPFLASNIKGTNDEGGDETKTDSSEYSKKQVRVAAYHHFTPPLMVITEVKKGTKFDKETGKPRDAFKCFFYSTLSGTFEENWFKKNELKTIVPRLHSLYQDYKEYDLTKLKEDLIGKQAIMTTVDMELGKISVYKDSDPARKRYREKHLLDFLPPLGTIISVSTIDTPIKFDENSGNIDFIKCRIKVKLRWYNNKSGKFSEEEVPLNALKNVEMPGVKTDLKKDEIYLFPKKVELEGLDHPVIAKIPARFHDLVFNHYYYQYRVRNLFNHRLEICKENPVDVSPLSSSNPDIHQIISTSFGFDDDPENEKEMETGEWVNKWVKISYVDRANHYTTRIIFVCKIIDSFNGFPDGSHGDLVVANCLLRDGAIRHFRKKGILTWQVLPDEFAETFEDPNIKDR